MRTKQRQNMMNSHIMPQKQSNVFCHVMACHVSVIPCNVMLCRVIHVLLCNVMSCQWHVKVMLCQSYNRVLSHHIDV